ncbi:MAG: DNA polymerase III subunit alpha [Deltaproteobacteria bacterium]|nr:DNA polymerase III subunit alpha [Deltaproteobacteria bacterium]
MAFVHLHVHSQFSLLDGTMDPAAIAALAAEAGMPAVALTDTCNLYGAVTFYKACKKHGIKPILGAELHVQHEGIAFRDPERESGGYQLGVLVENDVGYRNLCQLITTAIFEGTWYKPRVDLSLLQRHAEGLIFLTGGRKGVVGRAVVTGHPEAALQHARDLCGFLGPDQLYFELQDLGLSTQEATNDAVRRIAAEVGRELVITNAAHYAKPDDAAVHELLNAVSRAQSLRDPDRILASTDQAWFKSEAEMRVLFPNDGAALDRTVQIADRCHYQFDFDTYHFPATDPPDVSTEDTQPETDANWSYFFGAFPPPRDFGLPAPSEPVPERPEGAGNLNGYFAWYASRGLELRLEKVPPEEHPAYRDRLHSEIEIIVDMGFAAYLLIVAEFINWSKDNDIPVGPARGSAAGSLVAWAMRITDIDPLQFDLLFERFLNPERVSMPDIDVDFCQDRREEVIEHVREKYGTEYVAQIITYGKLKARAAVRDVARVLGLSYPEADRIAKLVPEALGTTLHEALEQEAQLRVMREGDPKVRRVLNLAMAVEGNCRQTGVHAAGVVIADRPLVEHVPLYRDEPEGGPVIQYDMKSAESVGLIKFDFLGLKTLDQIRDAVKTIERNHGVHIDMSTIPVDDPVTYTLLQQGDALGIFQLESSGMRDLLCRLKPSNIDDMVALVALYRPGPLSSGMTDDFVLRKHDPRRIQFPLKMLEPILQSTYGTIVYQEQVMQIAQVMAGYSLGEADLLRRAMGKKKKAEMDQQRTRFVEGSVANGIHNAKAEEIFDLLAKFAAYGFNKSHSAAYGYISYQTAWLKAHYRPEYMAALMTIEAANTDKVLGYIEDCRRAGIRVEPVDINRSEKHFHAPPPQERAGQDVIWFGLSAVKNVGSTAVDAILEAREGAGGHFDDPMHFLETVDHRRVNRRVMENLVKAGAFDCFGLPRSAMVAGLEAAVGLAHRRQQDREAGQASLFAALPAAAKPGEFRFPDIAEWPLSERLAHEREVLGMYLTGHPMEACTEDIARFATCPIADLERKRANPEVRVVGLPEETRVVRTRRGDTMAFVRVGDEHGAVECVFFADPWAKSQRALELKEPVLVKGRVEHRDDEVKVVADSAELLSEVRNRSTREVRFQVSVEELEGDRLQRFLELLRDQQGKCTSRLVVRVPGRFDAHLQLPNLGVEPSTALQEGVRALFGRADVVAMS